MNNLLKLKAEVENRSQIVRDHKNRGNYEKALEELGRLKEVIEEARKPIREKEKELEEKLEGNLEELERRIVTHRLLNLDENELRIIRKIEKNLEKIESQLENQNNKKKGMINMKTIIEMIEEVLETKPLIEKETIERVEERIEETRIEEEIELNSITVTTRPAEYYEAEEINQHPRNYYNIKILGYNPGEDYLEIYDGNAYDYIEHAEEGDVDRYDPKSVENYIGGIEGAAAVYSLYKYNHGGSSFSTRQLCPFDSNLVGLIVIKEDENPENIEEIIKDLNNYINPTGYVIDIEDNNGDYLESIIKRDRPETLLELLNDAGLLEEIIEKEAGELEKIKELEKIRKLFKESKSDIGQENIIEIKIEELLLEAEIGLGDRPLKILNEIRQIEEYAKKEIEKTKERND